MADSLLVSTRKGLFQLERRGKTWDIVRTAFLGDPVSLAFHDRADGRIYAALKLGHFGVKLHVSEDEGASWQEIPCPAFPAAEGEAAKDGPSVLEIWAIEAGAKPGELWIGTIGGGLFHSTDRGQNWRLVESLWNHPLRANWFGGGNEAPGINSICVDPGDPKHIILSVSCGGVWQSADGGASWRLTAKGLHADYMPPVRENDPSVQDVHRLVQCRARPSTLWVQHHNGVFHSTDGGESWAEVTAIKPSKFGFAVAVHPDDPERAWFVPAVKDACRIPVDGAVAVARTGDGGRSFEVFRDGLPQRHAYDLVLRHGLAIDKHGRWLAMGSSSGNLWLSGDQGESWQFAAAHLPPIYALRFAGEAAA